MKTEWHKTKIRWRSRALFTSLGSFKAPVVQAVPAERKQLSGLSDQCSHTSGVKKSKIKVPVTSVLVKADFLTCWQQAFCCVLVWCRDRKRPNHKFLCFLLYIGRVQDWFWLVIQGNTDHLSRVYYYFFQEPREKYNIWWQSTNDFVTDLDRSYWVYLWVLQIFKELIKRY